MAILKNLAQSAINVVWTKPYEVFFGILGLLVAAPVVTLIWALTMSPDTLTLPVPLNYIVGYLLWLLSLVIMLNLGDEPGPSVRELFWTWIVWCLGFTVLAGIGVMEVRVIRWLFFDI